MGYCPIRHSRKSLSGISAYFNNKRWRSPITTFGDDTLFYNPTPNPSPNFFGKAKKSQGRGIKGTLFAVRVARKTLLQRKR